MSILTNLMSWSFGIGLLAGFLLSRAWELVKVCRADKRNPLPDGRRQSKWKALQIDPRWLAGAIGVTFLFWSVYTTQGNTNDNRENAAEATAFAARVQQCQAQLITAIRDSRTVTAQIEKLAADNDRLSQEERKLLADGQVLLVQWVGKLLDPQDPAVKDLAPNNPVRQQYNVDVTRGFFNRAAEINTRIMAIHDEQDRNDASPPPARPALPDPDCGS